MNANLVLMLGVALLLARQWFREAKWFEWVAKATAAVLLIQPTVAALKWLGGLVGV